MVMKNIPEGVQILGDYPKIVQSRDGIDEIVFGQFAVIPKKYIKWGSLNRDKITPHVGKMDGKIRTYGFLGVLIVFEPIESDGEWIYEPAEGNHRNESLDAIFGADADALITCLIMPPNYSVEEVDEAMEVIFSLNKDNKALSVVDYIKGWSKTKNRPIYKEMEQAILLNNSKYSNLTPPLTCYIYTGTKGTEYQLLKDGAWDLPDYNLYKPFVDMFMDTYRVWTANHDDGGLGIKTTEFHNTFSSNLVCMLWGKVKRSFEKNMTEDQRLLDFRTFLKFLDMRLRQQVADRKAIPSQFKNLPKAYDEIRDWFESHWDMYRQAVPEPQKNITVFCEEEEELVA